MKNRLLLLIAFVQMATLSFGQKYEMWGVTTEGGEYGKGTIFRTDSLGNNLSVFYNFPVIRAWNPGNVKLYEHTNGKLYGTSISSLDLGHGTIFEYDPTTNQVQIKLDFQTVGAENPDGGLILGPNGNLYGTTSLGGIYNNGTIYTFNPINDSFKIIHSFHYQTSGMEPTGELLLASNGKMYGLTKKGGVGVRAGFLFELDPSTNQVLGKASFNTNMMGHTPRGNLIQSSNGKLYGMTSLGGLNGEGVLFEFDIALDTLIKRVDFDPTIGENPLGSLFEASNGMLYGMLSNGGLNGRGTLFEFDVSSNTVVKKKDLSTVNSGSQPMGSFIEDSPGILLGVTGDRGTVFEYSYLSNTLTVKSNFSTIYAKSIEGDLIKTSTGRYFGTSKESYYGGKGGIFEYIKSTNTLKLNVRFGYNEIGEKPIASLIQAKNGKVYGSTTLGGNRLFGSFFEIDPINNTIRTISSLKFKVSNQLYQASNGRLYGVGQYNIFEVDFKLDTIKILHQFNNVGYNTPLGTPVELKNGKLYGTIRNTNGGWFYVGVYEYDIFLDTLIIKGDLPQNIYPDWTSGGLTKLRNGKAYGVSRIGGSNGDGVIYEYDATTNIATTLYNFDYTTGSDANNGLFEISNGVFIGLANRGGLYNKGVIYQFNTSNNQYVVKKAFRITTDGAFPVAGLIQGGQGVLFGLTNSGGNANNEGVLFEYNPVANSHFSKYIFSHSISGSNPSSSLCNVDICNHGFDTIQANSCNVYVGPSGKFFYQTGVYSDTLNNNGCDSIIIINLTVKKVNNTVVRISSTTLASNDFGATYQWLDCNNNYAIIPNETGQLFTPSQIGYYAVEVTANGCVDTSTCYPITIVGVSENQLINNLVVFPNPTNSNVTLSLGGMYGAFTTQVYNVHGKLIKESVHQSTNQVEVELGKSEGIYFIHLITSSGEKVVRKVVKK